MYLPSWKKVAYGGGLRQAIPSSPVLRPFVNSEACVDASVDSLQGKTTKM